MSNNHEEKNIPFAAEEIGQALSNSDEEYEAEITADGGVILTKYKGNAGNVVVPAAWKGCPVVGLQGTFSNNDAIKSVTIPNSVICIGDGAFYVCRSLVSVTIPDSVTTIGYCAFNVCSSLTSVTIPSSTTSIGNFAFCACSTLTTVTIPASVTSLGDGTFADCSSFTSINVDSNNGYYKSVNGVLFSKDGKELVAYPGGNERDYTIPDSVISIGDYAFDGCRSLTSVTIPESVTSIGYCAFYVCSSLTSITIPDSVVLIDDEAFSRCENLTVLCPENSCAWQYCEKNDIPHKPLG